MHWSLSSEEFDELVAEALEELPAGLASRISNLEIIVRDLPDLEGGGEDDLEDLLGLYEGVPLTERATDYFGFLPDRITLFKLNIESEAQDRAGVKEVVRATVLHEVAHHFGIDDDRLDELGWA